MTPSSISTDRSVPPEEAALAPGLFENGGAVGALMRDVDWAATPLGPAKLWPQSLRTAVSICLASRFPILVWWGPELVMLYNDAYFPLIGGKHPAALGRPGREVFPEIWDIIGPMLQGVMTHGSATWSADLLLQLERKGFAEECYFTFSYSPIRDESGGIGGVFTAVTETTERVLSERRLATLSDVAARTATVRRGPVDACGAAAAALAANPADVPFAAIYLRQGGEARLAATTALVAGDAAAPAVIALETGAETARAPWPVREVLSNGRSLRVDHLSSRLASLPGGPASEMAHTAVAIPIRRADQHRPYGVLVAGLSPKLELDERYSGFLELVAGQIATAVASASAFEEERHRAEALAELDRAKTTFFSNVSHEFRTPLSLMLGPLEDMLSDRHEPLPASQRERIELVHRNGLRLLKLVNSLLDFSRIEAGRVRASYEPVDLPGLTADLASSFRAATDRAGLTLVVDCPPLGEHVYVDVGMWEKVVLNLLSNAFKFTFTGEIRVTLARRDGAAELRVSDTGVGIPGVELPRIFERFHRVEGARSRTHEGSGIGLSLVQELVRLHGGTISVESVEGQGTAFTVRVPLGTAHLPADHLRTSSVGVSTRLGAAPFVEEALRWLPEGVSLGESGFGAAPAGPADSARAAEHPTSDRARVLVVDDNADMRFYLARLLQSEYEVEVAIDGIDALQRVTVRRPDLVISDVMMPGLDGVGLLQRLRADERTRTLPVILVSARAGEDATLDGLEAGADDYLVKPFSARELQGRVRAHVQLARSRADAERRLADIFQQAPAFLAVLRGPRHVFELANPSYRELVGHRPIIGEAAEEALPEIAGQGFLELLDRVYRTGEPFTATEARVALRRGDTLEERFLNFVYQPLRDPDGSIGGIVAHGVDVTAQVRARQEIERLYRTVQEASNAKTKFLSMMSHELRTPLNAITGFADLLALGIRGPVSPAQAQDLERIRGASQYLLGLINDLLNLTRLEAGQVEFRMSSVDLGEAIADAKSLVAFRLAEKAIRFAVVGCEDGIVVLTDRERLMQILLNLLTNAAKFTDPGGSITVRCAGDGELATIAVTDTGRGIPADQLERIFDPFVQVDRHLSRESQQGVGLGLAISRDLARGLGGDITVESAVGAGSTFTVTLPQTRMATSSP